ncbi:hypothetical protein SteCoe_33544 [Stentor coeruleus]|uniref:Methyltransferase type 11 domain-containing protein n=1 Tax=Stentor coeruleus TaxID=5963 RepID=A0A1R2AWI0_9CILI|nr:hypothetical protein SteCoe_33544 [Stentor coeruleus]
MVSRLEKIKETWNNYSQVYIETMEHIASMIYENIINLAKIESSSQILEVGCGPGNGVRILCSKKLQNATITACDISESMISIAQSRNFPNCNFLVANNEELPFECSSFDRYIANLSLHVVENPIKMIEEAYRVLQPGGIALFSTFSPPGPGNFMTLIENSASLVGAPKNPNKYFDLNNDEYVKKLLKDSGFTRTLSFYSSACIPATTVDEVLRFIGRNHVVEEVRAIDSEMHKKLLESMREETKRLLDNGQLITFDYLAVVAIRDS